MAHVYKDLLIALAEGKEIQARYVEDSYWFDPVEYSNYSAFCQLFKGSAINGHELEFRIKPRTHIVNGHEINAPEVRMPKSGEEYWTPAGKGFVDDRYVCGDNGDRWDVMYLKAGIMYLTEEDAQAHSNAWLNPKV